MRERDSPNRSYRVEPLEPRLLLAADWLGGLAPAWVSDANASVPLSDLGDWLIDVPERDTNTRVPAALPGALDLDALVGLVLQGDEAVSVDSAENPAPLTRHELVIIDIGVDGYEELVADIESRRHGLVRYDVFVLESGTDGVQSLSDILSGYRGLDAVHLVAHGTDGGVQLGDTRLDAANVGDYAQALRGWAGALGGDADLLIYGCDLAAGESGRALLDTLGALTQADVTASSDATGLARLGGDWDLEYSRGDIDSGIAFSAQVQSNWSGLLATFTVNTADDTVDANPGDGFALDAFGNTSLRAAIMEANVLFGADTIRLPGGDYQLTLGGFDEDAGATGDLDIRQDLTIVGAGADTTSIQANGIDRVIEVHSVSAPDVAISGVTVEGGDTTAAVNSSGGGIRVRNGASLALTDVVVSGNQAFGIDGYGGGISSQGNLALANVELSENKAEFLGGGLHLAFAPIDVTLTNVTISGNSADEGGGLYTQLSPTLTNVTIADNTAVVRGGGISVPSGHAPILTNSLIADNMAPLGPDIDGAVASTGDNLVFDTRDASGLQAGDIQGLDPFLGALSDHGGSVRTHALLFGSPAIDANTVAAASTNDQRGFLRDSLPDIGAYEQGATSASAGLWLSTRSNVVSGGAPELPAWSAAEVIRLADPDLAFGTTSDGTWSSIVDFQAAAFTDGNVDVVSLHRVATAMTLGGNGFAAISVAAGDLLLTTVSNETWTNAGPEPDLSASNNDVILFHPDIPGDYSSGTFSLLLEDPLGSGIHAISLVEADTQVGPVAGGTLLPAGSFVVVPLNGSQILAFTVDDVGLGSTTIRDLSGAPGLTTLVLDGPDFGFTSRMSGIELIESDAIIAGTTVKAGDFLVSLFDADAAIGDGVPISADRWDVVLLRAIATGATSSADAFVFLDGNPDVHLDAVAEGIDGLTLARLPAGGAGNNAPVANDDSYDVDPDTTLVVDAASGLLANDTDLDFDPLTLYLFSEPLNGRLSLNPIGLTDLRNLSLDASNDNFPDWSPDSSQIAFASARDGDFEIYVIDADGSGLVQLTSDAAAERQPVWSPDGTQILYRSDTDGTYDIYVMDADGSNPVRLTNGAAANGANELDASWSPDGSKIVYVMDLGAHNIFIMDADGSNPQGLTTPAAQDRAPAWSPDGTRIVFVSDRDGNDEIYVMDADGSNVVRLTTNVAIDGAPAWSPDGSRILFHSNIDSDHELYVMDADGSNVVQITDNLVSDRRAVWSPDGTRIAFQTDRDGNEEVYVSTIVSDGGFSYTPDPGFAGVDSFTYRVTDGIDKSDPATVTLTVTAGAVDTTVQSPTDSTTEDVDLVFSVAGGNAIMVDDGTTNDAVLRTTLTVTNGVLNLASTAGLISVTGDGTSTVTVIGVESAINASLDGLTYSPTPDYDGAATLQVTTDLQADLLGFYNFTQSNPLGNDSSPAGGNDGTASDPGIFPDPYAVFDGVRDSDVLVLDGIDDNISIPGRFGTPTSVTLAAWVNVAPSNNQEVISLGSIALRLNDVGVGVGVTGFFHDGTSWSHTDSSQFIGGDGWHHVAFTYDDANNIQVIYIDGVALGTTAYSESINWAHQLNSTIGSHANSSSYWLDGMLDDVRVYDRALSAGEIQALASDQFSDTEVISITVDPENDAPVLADDNPALSAIAEDDLTSAGDAVATIIVDGTITDPDGVGVESIAIIAVDNSNGTWQYSTDNGGTWSNVDDGALSANHALLLDGTLTGGATQRLRFVPSVDYNGSATFTFRAWDMSGGAAGTYADTSTAGGVSPYSSATDVAVVDVTPVNDAPSFNTLGDQSVLEDSGPHSVAGFATALPGGGADESGQTFSYTVNSDNPGLFLVGPAIDASGTLTYTLNANVNGTATITVSVTDDGGTANGGVDTSADQTFDIIVGAVNDAPSFNTLGDQSVLEDSGPHSVAGFATALPGGGADESGQTFSYTVNSDNPGLFLVGPAIDASGTLTYTLNANVNGTARVTVSVSDDGGTANGGVDTSADQTFDIIVGAVNDAPSFNTLGDQNVLEDSGPHSVAGFATALPGGGADESGQTFSYTVNSDNPGLFLVGPAIDASGTLTYTLNANVNGTATITVSVTDDGGTANGGVDTSADQTFDIIVGAVNDAPSFNTLGDQSVLEDSGPHSVAGFATALPGGGADESGQTFSYTVNSDNPGLFLVGPAIDASGTLTYTLNANVNGTARVTVSVSDDGGTANGGVDTSADQTFDIIVGAVNDAPSFNTLGDQSVLEDSGPHSVAGFATALPGGGADESGQTFSYTVNSDNPGLFLVGPAIDASGTLTYTLNANVNGTARVTVSVSDDGGTANGGVDTSADQTFDIIVGAVNDAPSFNTLGDQSVLEDSGPHSVAGFATALPGGGADESGQTFSYTVNSDNPGLFLVGPAIDASGTLTYTLNANVNGTARVTVSVSDDGGTANGGVDTSADQTFDIIVGAVNDAPSFNTLGDQSVLEDSGPHSVAGFATALPGGGADESGQTFSYTVNSDNPGLFLVGPAIDASGTLTYTLNANVNGTARVTVSVSDDGGTANGGVDTSADQTFDIIVGAVNDAPSFNTLGDQNVLEDSGPHSVAGFATALPGGGADESGQTFSYTVNSDNPGLFLVGPAIDASGTLTYTLNANVNGTARVTVSVSDDGGTANGGVDTSADQTFDIIVGAVNDAPSFNTLGDQSVLEDSGPHSVAGFATALPGGGADESGQAFSYTVSSDNPGLFLVGPAIDASGTLTYTLNANVNGTARVTVSVSDDGGTANGGVDTSADQTFDIIVGAVNDAPSFNTLGDQSVLEDSGPHSVAGFATALPGGGADESGQAFSYTVSSDNPGLFLVGPAIDASGTLTYTLNANVNGTARVTVSVSDDGGTANGGVDTSADQTFDIIVGAVNDAPSFSTLGDQNVLEGSGPHTVTGFATASPGGGADESGQSLSFALSSDNPGLFLVAPTIDANGTLTYTLNPGANGTARITVMAIDSGGTANGGDDTSTQETFDIMVMPLDSAPTATGLTQSHLYLEDSGPVALHDVLVSVSGGNNLVTATLTLSDTLTGSLSATSGNGETYSSITGQWTVTGTVAEANAALGAVQFVPVADNDISSTVFTRIQDAAGQGPADGQITLSVTPVNDAPQGNDSLVSLGGDSVYVLSMANFGYADPVEGHPVRGVQITSLPAWAGTLTIDDRIVSVGDTVSAGDIEAGRLRFIPLHGIDGTVFGTLAFQVQDDGGTAAGGIDVDPSENYLTLVVTQVIEPTAGPAVNDAPMPSSQESGGVTAPQAQADEPTVVEDAASESGGSADGEPEANTGSPGEQATPEPVDIPAVDILDPSAAQVIGINVFPHHSVAVDAPADEVAVAVSDNQASVLERQFASYEPLMTESQDIELGLEQMRDALAQDIATSTLTLGGTAVSALGLSVGYVSWLMRGGVLLGSVVSSLPVWTFIDPLPVFARDSDERDEDGEDQSLAAIVSSGAAANERANAPTDDNAPPPELSQPGAPDNHTDNR